LPPQDTQHVQLRDPAERLIGAAPEVELARN
jgi:hypothetical protein